LNQDVEKLWELQTVLTALSEREKQLNSKPESFAAVDRAARARLGRFMQGVQSYRRHPQFYARKHVSLLTVNCLLVYISRATPFVWV